MKQKGFAPPYLLIGAIIVVAVVFIAPLPYYQQKTEVLCKTDEGYKICPTAKGWQLGSSLWDKLFPKREQSLSLKNTKPEVVSSTPLSISTPEPIANWKTYTNNKLGISFKYPKDFEIETENVEISAL